MSKKNDENNSPKEIIVDRDDMEIQSFSKYKSSDDGNTKIVNGEKHIEDFHIYKEEK